MTLKSQMLIYFVLSMPSVMISWNDGGEMSVQQHEATPAPDPELFHNNPNNHFTFHKRK